MIRNIIAISENKSMKRVAMQSRIEVQEPETIISKCDATYQPLGGGSRCADQLS
jgi:hypothetical protein